MEFQRSVGLYMQLYEIAIAQSEANKDPHLQRLVVPRRRARHCRPTCLTSASPIANHGRRFVVTDAVTNE